MRYFLGVDVGGSKSHALIANELGEAVGFGSTGPGNWEVVGYQGLTNSLKQITSQAIEMASISISKFAGAGFGLAGYDWPAQRQAHLDAIQPLGLACPFEIVNDAVLGILAGSANGWGVSVVSGTGCNCRGWSKDRRREGRVVGGGSHWSGEAAGSMDIVARAMRAVAYQWDRRGPSTALAQAFIEHTGAVDLNDLIEGLYLKKYAFRLSDVMLVFKVAAEGDPLALEVIRWAGDQLGQMACGVINQLELHEEPFDVVLIGSLFGGHPLLIESLRETVQQTARCARLVRLTVPPVVGGVLLGMEVAGMDPYPLRDHLIETTRQLIAQ
ncbi:MAG: ATPase [Chloroflexota bacterium]|nr:MAG: ATPase [Chloroflexota bacterium]